MRKKGVNLFIIISAFVLFGISVGLSIYYIFSLQENNSKYFHSYNHIEENELREILIYQEETDMKLQKVINEGKYTIDEPFLMINPYKINPLSAVIAFNTEDKSTVEVYVNDKYAYTVKATKDHIIPIYGLFNNAVNIVRITCGNDTKELEINTNVFNYNHDGIEMHELVDEKTHYFILGDINDKSSTLRGFDEHGNMIYYLDLDYISGVKFYNTRLYVGYNGKYSKGTELKDLKLEMDYLGKIYGISTNLTDLDTEGNIDNGNLDENYIGTKVNIYRNTISNLNLSKRTDNLKYSEYDRLSTNELSSGLDNALVYDKNYRISTNGAYLTYDIDEEDGELILVNKDTYYTYKYPLDDKKLIKLEPIGESSLYLKKDGKYYTLLTTIKN